MTGTKDLLAEFRGKGQAAPPAKEASEKQPYRAFEPSKNERRYLEFRIKCPEPCETYSNAELTSITAEWRMGLVIGLVYHGKRTIDIRGERLTELYRAIVDWKVEWLAEFDPLLHEQPTDSLAPFIASITVTTERPKEPPPQNQRH